MTSTLSQLLFVYVLGGLTFIPLVLAAVLVPAWLALPKIEDGAQEKADRLKTGDKGDEKTEEKLQVGQEEQYGSDGDEGTATGIFAVLRKYDFPAANAALATKSGSVNPGGGVNGAETAAEGHTGSESVYQSMYRSVFDRSRTTTPPNALSSTSDGESTASVDPKGRRKMSKPAPANVFFIVLRHGHLMLYDSPAQLEVRHVISLAHHSVKLSDGEDTDVSDGEPMTDGDLFIKRTAILLTPLATVANGTAQAQALPPRPFYLFTPISTQKESFYHALLLASPSPPTPQALDPHDLIKLQTTLHATVMTAETRALNAIISRIYLALSGTNYLKDLIRTKIEKKISRVQKPGFINALALQEIDLGAAAPVVANLRLKDLNISGDVTISCDVRYTGGISLALAAQAKLDLGPRFKARTVDLLLASSLKRLSGHVLVRIKPPPSNRLWFCFDGLPDMEIKIEPVVSSRQITYGFILRQIEERIRAVIAETLVKPNWDDIPFFDTRSQVVRGGIWAHVEVDTLNEDTAPTEADMLARKGEKTMSMPALPHIDTDGEGTSSGTDTPRGVSEAELKRRSVISLPAQTSSTPHLPTVDSDDGLSAAQATRSLRSPSLTSPSASAPSVALDDSSANFDPSQKPLPQKTRTWGRRQMAPPPTRKEAVDAVREMRDRAMYARDAEGADSGGEAVGDRERTSEEDDGLVNGIATPDRTGTGFSTASGASSTSASTMGTSASTKTENARQKKAANLFAAATTATTAAKNWSWNAIQNRAAKNTAGRRASESSQHEPMGRGQPLPPPGMPLPGPQKDKSLWTGSGFGVAGLSGSMKRKPVLPKRPVERVKEEGEDEFGDWEENSGNRSDEPRTSMEEQASAQGEHGEIERPPPLPKRRAPGDESAPAAAPAHALGAARLASSASSNKPTTGSISRHAGDKTGETDLSTAAADLDRPNASSDQGASEDQPATTEPSALPARTAHPAAVQSHASNSDPEDLVVVAAPVESGRNTPVATATDPLAEAGKQAGTKAKDEPPRYDGNEWGEYDEDEDRYGHEEDQDEGMPKASFSRSRDDGYDLHD